MFLRVVFLAARLHQFFGSGLRGGLTIMSFPRKNEFIPPMEITAERVWADFRVVRETIPLVLSLTNSVVQEFTANALLALGASPIMSDALEEITELVDIANALKLNIGTPTP